MFQEYLPAFIVEAVKKVGDAADPILFSTSTDLSAEGRPERQWLLLCGRQLVLMSESEQPAVLQMLAVDEAETFRTHAGVGSGFLQARIGGVWMDVVRYSNSLAGRFVQLAAKLEAMRDGGDFVSRPEDEIDDRHCPGCGLALSFAGDVCPRCINRGAVFSRVWELLRPYRYGVWAVCALILLGVALELAPPKLQQYLVDHVLETDARGGTAGDLLASLLAIVGALAATRVLLALVNAAKRLLANRIGTAMTSALRGRMVAKLQTLSVDYYDRYPVGVLMSRVAHDTEAMYGLIHQLTGGLLLQTLQLAGVGVMLFTLNAKLALWTLVPMPLVLYGSWFFWKHVYPRYFRYWDSASKQAGTLAGMLSGIRVVKAFAQERREFDRFRTSSDSLRQSRLEVEGAASTFSAVMQLVFSLGGLIVWFVGGRDVLGSQMSLGGLMAFLAYLAMFYTPLSTLAQLTTWLTSFLTASQRVFELLDTTPRVAETETAIGDLLYDGLFAVRALPASYPDQFISLRFADDDGQEHEIGLVRDLADWPAEDRALLEQALARRYFVRVITAIESIEFKYNLLMFQVQTDRGPASITIRNNHSKAQDYGDNGKLLIDVDDNRYLIPNLDALPRRQHLLFRRYVYW